MTADQRKGLTIDVRITDTDAFKELLGVVHKIIMDERMPASLSTDAAKWLCDVVSVEGGSLIKATPRREQIVILCQTISLGKSMWQHRKHKYNPDAQLMFLGKDNRTIVDGLRPDKVIRLRGWEDSKGAQMNWLTRDGNKPEVIDETGDEA